MRPRMLFFIILILLLPTLVVTASPGATHTVHLPLVLKPAFALPQGPLLLVRQNRQLVWVSSSGDFRHQITEQGNNSAAIVSPDGQSILYREENANSPSRNLLMPAVGGTAQEVPVYITNRSWSPDGQYLAWLESNNVDYVLKTYHIPTGTLRSIERNTDDVYTWHPATNQLYYLKTISEEDVSLYRSNPDGSDVHLTLETPDREWMLQVIPDGRVLVSGITPERYHIGAINPDGSNYTLLKDLRRGVIVVSVSPYGTGFFYQVDGVFYWDDITGANVNTFTVPCEPPYTSCSRSLVRIGRNEVALRWFRRISQYKSDFTLYTLATTPGATPRLIATGSIGAFQYSPDGRYLAYEEDGDLYIHDIVAQQVIAAFPDTELQMWRP